MHHPTVSAEGREGLRSRETGGWPPARDRDERRLVSVWLATTPGLRAADWAAMVAQIPHLSPCDDGRGVAAFGWLSHACLAAGFGFFVAAGGA